MFRNRRRLGAATLAVALSLAAAPALAAASARRGSPPAGAVLLRAAWEALVSRWAARPAVPAQPPLLKCEGSTQIDPNGQPRPCTGAASQGTATEGSTGIDPNG